MTNSGIKVAYFDLTSSGSMQAMFKIANSTDFMSGEKAYEVKKLFAEFKRAKKAIQEHYEKEIVATFAKKDEDGKVIPEDPSARNPEGFNLDETKQAEFDAAKEAFGKNEIILNCRPLTLDVIAGLKGISPMDMDSLGLLLVEKL